MAILYKCDRCQLVGKEILEKVNIPGIGNNSIYRNERVLDLCNRCLKELNEFADPIPVTSQIG